MMCQYLDEGTGVLRARRHKLFDGLGDWYISHDFVMLYWRRVVYALKATYPSLRKRK